MLNRIVALFFVAVGGVLSLTGCSTTVAVRPVPAPVVVYRERPAPPPLIIEEQPAPPPYRVTWVRGHWHWNGHRYVWHHGHYRAV